MKRHSRWPFSLLKKRREIIFSTLAASVGLTAPAARADFFIHSWDNHHESSHAFRASADFYWYSSSTDYDPNGSTFTPAGLSSYHRSLIDLSGLYGITPNLSVYGRLSWAMSQVDSNNPASFTGTSYGLGDQTAGLNYRIYRRPGGATLDLQLQGDFPAYSNTSATTNRQPFLGNSSIDVTGGGFLSIPLGNRPDDDISLVGGLGYTYRNSGFSSAIPWSVSTQLVPHAEGLVANLGVYGYQSLNTDVNTDNLALINNAVATSYGSGGSYITNAINPSLLTFRGQVGYVTSNDLQFTGTVGQSFWGRNAPNGLTLAVGLQTHFGSAGAGSETGNDPALQSPNQYGRSNQGYVSYNLEAKVLRANDRFNLIKIDKGSDEGISVGDLFDIFMNNPNGSVGPAIARGRVTSVRPAEAAVKIDEYYKEVWIEEGFTARRPIR